MCTMAKNDALQSVPVSGGNQTTFVNCKGGVAKFIGGLFSAFVAPEQKQVGYKAPQKTRSEKQQESSMYDGNGW